MAGTAGSVVAPPASSPGSRSWTSAEALPDDRAASSSAAAATARAVPGLAGATGSRRGLLCDRGWRHYRTRTLAPASRRVYGSVWASRHGRLATGAVRHAANVTVRRYGYCDPGPVRALWYRRPAAPPRVPDDPMTDASRRSAPPPPARAPATALRAGCGAAVRARPGRLRRTAGPPGAVSGEVDGSRVRLSWVAASDDEAVTGYNVYRDDAYLTTVRGTTHTAEIADGGTSAFYTVAFDTPGDGSARGYSTRSPEASFSRAAADDPDPVAPDTPVQADGPPRLPTAPVATRTAPDAATLRWTASANAAGYNVYRDGAYATTVRATSLTDVGLEAGRAYEYYVVAFDDGPRFSTRSAVAVAAASAGTSAPQPVDPPARRPLRPAPARCRRPPRRRSTSPSRTRSRARPSTTRSASRSRTTPRRPPRAGRPRSRSTCAWTTSATRSPSSAGRRRTTTSASSPTGSIAATGSPTRSPSPCRARCRSIRARSRSTRSTGTRPRSSTATAPASASRRAAPGPRPRRGTAPTSAPSPATTSPTP